MMVEIIAGLFEFAGELILEALCHGLIQLIKAIHEAL
jgi:hypothetical protein